MSGAAAQDPVRAIAQAVLYEGYLLWPYRRSSLKNRQRWTFGGVQPRDWCRGRESGERWWTRAECLLEADPVAGVDVDHAARVDVEVRFLHVVERRVAWREAKGLRFVDELDLGDRQVLAWDEATERACDAGGLTLRELATPQQTVIAVPADSEEERVVARSGREGAILRSWQALRGAVSVQAVPVGPNLFRLRVDVVNTTPGADGDREEVMRRSFAATHLVLRIRGGAFVSATDPPEALRGAAEACKNEGVWPVLVGGEGDRQTMLASPIILEDHPRIAPESPGDLFDASEIDQLLVLSLLSMPEAERREMQASDPRAREILERTDGLQPEALRRLHGAIRHLRGVGE